MNRVRKKHRRESVVLEFNWYNIKKFQNLTREKDGLGWGASDIFLVIKTKNRKSLTNTKRSIYGNFAIFKNLKVLKINNVLYNSLYYC